MRYSESELRVDAIDPLLESTVLGSLLLLREDLADSARRALIDAVVELGDASYSIDARYAANWCADVLGANEGDVTSRRRRFAFVRR